MFQQIEPDQLQYNEKYKIIENNTYFGVYKFTLTFYPFYVVFEKVRPTHEKFLMFFPNQQFYKFVSQKERIQTNMELRALNQIRVLGDHLLEKIETYLVRKE